jgi:hypothetical protein
VGLIRALESVKLLLVDGPNVTVATILQKLRRKFLSLKIFIWQCDNSLGITIA